MGLGPKTRDPIAEILVGIDPVGLDLRQEFLGRSNLFELLLSGGKTHLLVPEFPHRRDSIFGVHFFRPFVGSLLVRWKLGQLRVQHECCRRGTLSFSVASCCTTEEGRYFIRSKVSKVRLHG